MPAQPSLHGRAKRMELMAIVLQPAALRLRPSSAREQWRRSLLPNGPRVSAAGQNDEREAYSYNVVREMWILPRNVLFVSLAGRRMKRRSNRPIQ